MQSGWFVRLGEVDATVVMQGMAMTNGYVYVIDRVLYSTWDLQYSGATPITAALSTTLLLSLVVKYLL